MSTREVIRRGGESGGVPFHEHDASEISGKFDFLRALKAIIDGTVEIGGTVTVSADQLFIDNVLQHINLRETDDNDYPDKVFIVDVNGGLGRIVWADNTGGPTVFTDIISFAQNGRINVSTGPFSPTDGTAAAPAIVRDATADGIFFASGVVGLAIGGSEIARADAGGLVFTVDGSAANPAIARSATEDGVFFASGAVGVAIGGSEKYRVTSAGLQANSGSTPAYLYGSTVYFTSTDTFDKGDYPGLRAVKAKVQAGGGGGGSATATDSMGGGGGGGGYAEAFVLAASLATSETVTVGAGGGGGSAGNGGNGGASSFGSHAAADGGLGGGNSISTGTEGDGGASTAGDFGFRGGDGDFGGSIATTAVGGVAGGGGNAHLGHGAPTGPPGGNGRSGSTYGGGGGGGRAEGATDRDGGAGGAGVIIVDLYY